MFKYTLAFIKRKDEILMLNRYKSPWMGSWNGVGGKRLTNETLITSLKREIYEETEINITDEQITNKGYVTWNSYDENGQGLHVFLVVVPDDFEYITPRVTNEGILDWKKITWISDFDNYGVCSNIPYFITDIINDNNRYNHYCTFSDRILLKVDRLPVGDTND